MNDVIEADPIQAGLPPPLLLTTTEASQLIYVLRQDRGEASIIQLLAARNGEGVSTLARDVSLVAASTNGLRTLLLAAEPPGRRANDWTRSIYGMPSGVRPLADGPEWLQALRIGESSLVLATPESGPVLQPPAWISLLRQLRTAFDLVVIDSPALERAFTGIMLAPYMDANVIVVAAESTRASATRTLRDRISEVGGHTTGAILNKRRFHVPRAAYERL